jgi:hypothetical protein
MAEALCVRQLTKVVAEEELALEQELMVLFT